MSGAGGGSRLRRLAAALAAVTALTCGFAALSQVAPEDPAAALDQPQPSPRLAPQDPLGTGQRVAGNPTGPRTIPHRIDGHQLHLNYNRCLACHGQDAPAAVRATPMPPTHYFGRDDERRQPLAGGRYACTACHVPQHRLGGER